MPKSWSEKFARPLKPGISRLGKPYAGHAEGEAISLSPHGRQRSEHPVLAPHEIII